MIFIGQGDSRQTRWRSHMDPAVALAIAGLLLAVAQLLILIA
jgi:hypothetical protein